MPAIRASILAPEFRRGEWLNTSPLTMAQLRGKIVLVDFWDYSCLNCLRTLPYVQEWWRRYQQHDFLVVGVHTPEFAFAREPAYVQAAVQRLDITYPVLHDAQRETWQAWRNRYWPAKYLVDAEGRLRFFQFGEGHYQELEQMIQQLLRTQHPQAALPSLMPLLRATDDPETVCLRATPELYLGYERGRLGNTPKQVDDVVHCALPEQMASDTVYLAGDWYYGAEAVTLSSAEGMIEVRYQAKEVNLVMQPPERVLDGHIVVEQDGTPLSIDALGCDLQVKEGKTLVQIDAPRLYQLVQNPTFGQHVLRVRMQMPGVSAYAFTFVTDCYREERPQGIAA